MAKPGQGQGIGPGLAQQGLHEARWLLRIAALIDAGAGLAPGQFQPFLAACSFHVTAFGQFGTMRGGTLVLLYIFIGSGEGFRRACILAEQALQPPADDMLVAGQTRLMGVQDLSDLERLRELFELFSSKREILQLLERTIQAPGVRIFIGEETGMMPLQGVSLVTAPYTANGQVLGVLGVIGPKRMAYDRMIPLVQATADVLGAAFSPAGRTPGTSDA